MVRASRSQSLRNEHGKPPTVSSLFNRGTSVVFPKLHATNTESPPNVSSLFNRGTSITFPKVYVRSTEGFASMVSRVESAEEKEERLRRRRERDRLVIPASLDG